MVRSCRHRQVGDRSDGPVRVTDRRARTCAAPGIVTVTSSPTRPQRWAAAAAAHGAGAAGLGDAGAPLPHPQVERRRHRRRATNSTLMPSANCCLEPGPSVATSTSPGSSTSSTRCGLPMSTVPARVGQRRRSERPSGPIGPAGHRRPCRRWRRARPGRAWPTRRRRRTPASVAMCSTVGLVDRDGGRRPGRGSGCRCRSSRPGCRRRCTGSSSTDRAPSAGHGGEQAVGADPVVAVRRRAGQLDRSPVSAATPAGSLSSSRARGSRCRARGAW